MRRILAVALAFAALLISPAVVPAAVGHTSAAPQASIAKHCGAGYTRARIGGRTKCLRAGEYCAKSHRKQYPKYGYHCGRIHGVWRLH